MNYFLLKEKGFNSIYVGETTYSLEYLKDDPEAEYFDYYIISKNMFILFKSKNELRLQNGKIIWYKV